MTWRILNAESKDYSPQALGILQATGDVDSENLNRADLIKKIVNYDALIVRLGNKIDVEILNAAPRLKAIVSATTGLNHIDTLEAKKRGIEILSLQGEEQFLKTVTATAEHAFGLILALTRKIPASVCDVTEGNWSRDKFKGNELSGKTLGIIGYGRLGKLVAGYASAFGMRVIANDIKPTGDAQFLSLPELLKHSDIVSLHASYTPDNENLVDGAAFGAMKHGAYFINTARGELVDEAALLQSLQSGHLAGAALDVLRSENTGSPKNDPLVAHAQNHDNLIITPHIGGATFESMQKTEIFMAEKLRDFIRNHSQK